MSFIRSFLGLIIAIALAAFAIFNRDPIQFTYSPAHDPLTMPLYIILLGGLLGGFIMGAIAAWMSEGKNRREKRKLKKQVKTLEKQLDETQRALSKTDPAGDMFPSITAQKK